MPSLIESLDRTLSIGRIPAMTGTEWGGDQADDFVTVATGVGCRLEITDIDSYTIWIMDETLQPKVGDRFDITGWSPQIEVIRSKTWTDPRGDFHHYEATCKVAYPTRIFVDV